MIEHPHLKTRRFRVVKDQHGRKWHAQFDTTTNDPIGALRPHEWSAPWTPPSNIVKVVHDQDDGSSGVFIDYEDGKARLRIAHKEWNERLLRVGYQRAGDDFDPANPSPAVLYEVGNRPSPLEPMLAAEAGDQWVLGLIPADPMPEWARPIFLKAKVDETAFLRRGVEGAPKKPAAVKRGRGRPRKSPIPITPAA